MSRRKKSVKRPILPDARYDRMDLVETRTSQSGVTIFKQALTDLKHPKWYFE